MKNSRFTSQLPNMITCIRLGGAVGLLFLETFSLPFYIVYALCGVTDIIDGFIARKFNLVTKLGSVLDSLADLLFFTSLACKLYPVFRDEFEVLNWVLILVPLAFHIIAYILCAIKFKKFSAVHTYANKAMSAMIFLFPFTFIGDHYWVFTSYMIVGGVIALYSSIEINLIHLKARRYDIKNKTIFHIKRNEMDMDKGV